MEVDFVEGGEGGTWDVCEGGREGVFLFCFVFGLGRYQVRSI